MMASCLETSESSKNVETRYSYDVFLSFRGADVAQYFVDHLSHALRGRGITTFRDDNDLPRGKSIRPELIKAIEESRYVLVIFSENYASSTWCLDELTKIVECKDIGGGWVIPIFYKINPSDVRKIKGSIQRSFAKHEEDFKDDPQKLEKWKAALTEVASMSGMELGRGRYEAQFIQLIVQEIDNRLGPRFSYQRYELPVGEVVGRTFQSDLEKIWDYLMSENVETIGVHGIGGVGKTSLMTCIHNRIVNDCVTFESSCWVSMLQDCSVRKLQVAIARHLLLELENYEEATWAWRLCKELSSRKFLIILDDVWEYFPLQKVGIPLGGNGCKLILTSKNKEVFDQIILDKLVEVKALSKQEAWYLFRDNLRHGSLLSLDVEEIAQAVVRECVGLPLEIMVLSRSMRGVNNIHEWQKTLQELQDSNLKVKHVEDRNFTSLRLSYQRLRDSIVQQCFLHIALYPEGEEVDREELLQYFIDFRLIEGGRTRRAQFDQGNAILNKLVTNSLLEEGRGDSRLVKMHGLMRDMAINITNGHFMVKAGKKMRKIPNGKEWFESLEKVSLMCNDIEEITPDVSPQCPNISTLFLHRNPLISIPDSFFRHMRALQILNLSFTQIKELPNSFSDLENLTALHLSYCPMLRSVPSLAKMRALRTLNLYRCGIDKMPQGMERFRSLMYLDLGGTKGLEGMQWPPGILTELVDLQFLNFMEGPKIVKAEELLSLRKLEHVRCWFHDRNEYSTFMRCLWRRAPLHCKIDLRTSGPGHMMVDIKFGMQN